MTELIYPCALIDVEWLIANKDHPNLVVFDASWHLPDKGIDGKEEYLKESIPGSLYFDYDREIKDHNNPLPRMLPTEEDFTESIQSLGVNSNSLIVVYDNNEMFSSPRAWWMFRAMGHQNVSVLNGGLKAWKEAGQDVVNGSNSKPNKGNFKAKFNEAFVGSDYVLSKLDEESTVILDARSEERFMDAHMPNACNLHYATLIENGKLKPIPTLKKMFTTLLNSNQSLLCSCGSGVTACILALGAELSGVKDIKVYDGSWSEWGKGNFPVVKGV